MYIKLPSESRESLRVHVTRIGVSSSQEYSRNALEGVSSNVNAKSEILRSISICGVSMPLSWERVVRE